MDNGDLIKYNNQLYLIDEVEFDDDGEPVSLILQNGAGQIGGIALEDCEEIELPDEDLFEKTLIRFRYKGGVGHLYQTLTYFNLKQELIEYVFTEDYKKDGLEGFEGFLIEKSYISLPDEFFIKLAKLGL